MQTEMHEKTAGQSNSYDEELHDVLIAISVVAKRLAQKITENTEKKGENENGKD